MKKAIIFVFLICCFDFSIGQTAYTGIGSSSKEELQMVNYEKDPSAEAVVMYDIGKSFFTRTENGFELLFEREIKIKVFSKAGLKWAQFSIPYYDENHKSERIYDLAANTYNLENGRIVVTPLDPKNTYSEKFSENWYDIKFAMPDVKEGSVFVISYKILSPYLFNLRNWEFQSRIPVIHSEYTTKMIPFYEYIYVLQGAKKFDKFESFVEGGLSNQYGNISYQNMVYVFAMKDIPAFKDEAFITSINDYLIKIDFQLARIHYPNGAKNEIMTNWSRLSREMLDHASFGKYMDDCEKRSGEILEALNLDDKIPIEKAKVIDLYVKQNFNWNGKKDKFATIKAKEFLINKTGNCTDINLFLAGALKSTGIEAYPVLISTRDHGKIKIDYPFHHFFNYVIVAAKIDSSIILLDATSSLCTFNQIPSRCINDAGLIVKKKEVEWIDLSSSTESGITHKFNIVINPETDTVYQDCSLSAFGYEAVNYRNEILTDYEVLRGKLLNISGSGDSLKITNLHEVEKPVDINYKKKDVVQRLEGKIIVSPFCNTPLNENPLKQLSRNYPIDLIYSRIHTFSSTINIPEGYIIFKKPNDTNIGNNLVNINYTSEIINRNTLLVTGVYELRKDVYDSAEYSRLKGFYNIIVDKFNEDLILVKQD